MKYSVSAIVLGFFAAFNAAAPTPDDKPDAGQVTITGVTYVGSGCKEGIAHISKSPDWSTFTIIFDEYRPTIGLGVPFVEKRKNCNLNVNINYPQGCQYTLYTIDYTVFADLSGGVSVNQQSQYWFVGFVAQKATFQTNFHGPYTNTYSFTDTLASESFVWSPCGASITLNIDTQVLITSNDPK
ncbi:hypothetical protein B9Z19DRAFT_1032798, partial [Tuber borchii]